MVERDILQVGHASEEADGQRDGCEPLGKGHSGSEHDGSGVHGGVGVFASGRAGVGSVAAGGAAGDAGVVAE